MNSPDLFSLPVSETDLDRLEAHLRRAVLHGDAFLDEVVTHLITAGGKRIRPSLSIVSAAIAGGEGALEATLTAATSVELVHLASLYHDDVMDEAVIRRNVASVNARWGNLVAIVAGDFLLARSAELAASLGAEFAVLLASTLARLCQGQILETRSAFQIERSEEDYLQAIAGKTGALMATACRMGAMTVDLSPKEVDALATFGECFGTVFQIRDDVMDVVASEVELGKLPGQDLAEGIYTLPVQRALADRSVGPKLRPLLGHPLDRAQVEVARLLVSQSDAVEAAGKVARRYAEEAAEAVSILGDGPVVNTLAALSYHLLDDLERSRAVLAS